MPKTLGQILKQAREAKELSLRAVERATGIHNAHLSQIESGTIVRPEMSMLWDLAALYGIDYSELLRLARYTNGSETSGRQRQRMTVAMRVMGELSPKEQADALSYMAKLRTKRGQSADR